MVYDQATSQSLSIKAAYTDNTTTVYLQPGQYRLVYDNGDITLAEQMIVVADQGNTDVKTVKYTPRVTHVVTTPALTINPSQITPTVTKPIQIVKPTGITPILQVPAGTFVNPLINCPGYIYIRGYKASHQGVDMMKEGGCWISAAGDGVVTVVGWGSQGEGYNVVIDHGNGFVTEYRHGEGKFAVAVGDKVKAGQTIMYMGSSGNATGIHLHFDLLSNGAKVNPEDYVKVK